MLTLILFIIGFAILLKGGAFLVDASASLAKKLGLSNIFIGLTIVAFGTSSPELVVNIFASARGNADMAFGNIIGSNIVNLLLILGIAAVIYPIAVKTGTTWKEIPLSLLAVITIGFLANDALIDKQSFSLLTRIDGLILLSFFIIFLYYSFGISKAEGEEQEIKMYSIPASILLIMAGFAGLVIGGRWVVDGAIMIARTLGISEALIGLTIVAVGTSLPELVTSAIAAHRRHSGIAIGNIVGSNIFNIFFILGVSGIIRPLPFSTQMNTDIFILITGSILLFAFMFIGKKHVLKRWQGILFIVFYALYMLYLLIRG